MRRCKLCGIEKELNNDNFSIRQDKGRSNFRWQHVSMVEENFKKCWALDNLRPLSAKRNFLDGIFRKRHKR